jgi:CheY-like chemotaxis protein
MKQRVLVVDDDRLVADTLHLIFQASGFDSQVAYSAAEGLERARVFSPALVLCDVCMPEESGLRLVERLDREMPSCRAIMLSAYASNGFHVEQQSLHLRRPLTMLSKPCRPERLLQEARTLLLSA